MPAAGGAGRQTSTAIGLAGWVSGLKWSRVNWKGGQTKECSGFKGRRHNQPYLYRSLWYRFWLTIWGRIVVGRSCQQAKCLSPSLQGGSNCFPTICSLLASVGHPCRLSKPRWPATVWRASLARGTLVPQQVNIFAFQPTVACRGRDTGTLPILSLHVRAEIPAITPHSQRSGPIADPTAIMAISRAWGGICAALGIRRAEGFRGMEQ